MDWSESLQSLQALVETIPQVRETLERYETEAASLIAKYARQAGGLELDVDAIKATVTRPYTLLPINEHEANLIHWKGVKMPIFGWVVKSEAAFTIARVTRSMDLLTPLAPWMKQELGWKDPEHGAVIDGTRTTLRLTKGTAETFKKKYGAHLGKQNADGTYAIKGGDAWIKLVAQLVRDGILPYAATPVAPEHWDAKAKLPPVLADIIAKKEKEAGGHYIERAFEEFHAKGAVLVNYPPGAGKTLTSCAILNHFVGKVLILADSTILIEQWRDRVKLFAPTANVTLSTYQGAQKYLDQEWDLIIPDEAQRLPANTFSKLAFVKTKYRLGLTATPWREDDRQHLIVALSGFPVAIRWAELIAAGVLRRPRIIVVTVPSEQAKTVYVKQLVAKRKGRAIIFCDWIEQGQALANALSTSEGMDVPFVHGGTKNQLQRIQESDVAVVSRIGDRGLDLRDLRLVIEVAGQGSAREQFAQRVGRILHGDFEGAFYTVFTPEEAEKFRARVFGVEAELAGEVDIEFITEGKVVESAVKSAHVGTRVRTVAASKRATASASVAAKPQSEMEQMLAVPTIEKLIAKAESRLGSMARGFALKAIKISWDSPVTIKEILIARGGGDDMRKRWQAGFREAGAVELVSDLGGGRFLADKGKIKKIAELAGKYKK